MKTRAFALGICGLLLLAAGCGSEASNPRYGPSEMTQHHSKENTMDSRKFRWAVHDMDRPQPKVITPGEASTEDISGQPSSDAIVLFDGTDLSQWVSTKGSPAEWKVENGYMEVVKKTGSIQTKRGFGSCQLHIEWAMPSKVKGSGQGRGNSGVYLMNKYEVQILDSYNNKTYPDGQAASVYGQNPPMVNACRPPGRWQSYDIIFHRPIFKGEKLVRPATVTVLHNGVLVQDRWIIEGTAVHAARAKYTPHKDRLPLLLQNHGNPVRYRNVWVRELPEEQQ